MKKITVFIWICFVVPVSAFCQETFKITHGPYLQAMGTTGVNIIWTTNRNAISWVELAADDSTHFYAKEHKKYFAAENGLKNTGELHNVRIDGLRPDTRYRYRIYSQEVLSHEGFEVRYGSVAAARAFMAKLPVFKTNIKTTDHLSFAVINDMHQRNEVIKTLLNQVDWNNTDMVFFNGDMVNNSRSEDQLFSSFMDTADSIFADHIPMYYARGNHETRGEFASEFPKYFPTQTGHLYYLLRSGPVCFIILDTGEDKPDSDIEYSNITSFDNYRTREAAWLEKALKDPDYVQAPYKVVIGHIPPFGGWHGETEVAEKFIPLLNDAGAQIMLAAHLHRHVKKMPKQGPSNFPVLVNSNSAIIKAKVERDHLQIDMFDLQGKLIDSVRIDPSK
ncbi:FN3 domain-containing metallophosphoesterase family protein [Compostibacter hankyongensis]|uniref:Metallophosphoesterase n=1 Tax=Compostibacter hankyongensis TaxID=1007089 RepID=A0ABP8FZ32_9BACT